MAAKPTWPCIQVDCQRELFGRSSSQPVFRKNSSAICSRCTDNISPLRVPVETNSVHDPPETPWGLDPVFRPHDVCLLNHLIRPRQHTLRDRQADLLRCFEIDHQLELPQLLDNKLTNSFHD